MAYSKLRKILWVLIGIAIAIGLVSVYDRLVNGHANTGYGSYIPWGLWVATYIYYISLSAGAFLISALVYVFGVRTLEPIGRLSLFTALVSLIASILHIWFDLGHMERFWHVFASPNWSSLLNFMVWSYSVYFLLLLAEFFLAMRKDLWSMMKRTYTPRTATRDMRLLKIIASVGVPIAVAFHGGVGTVFGVLVARPYWHVGLYPILFLIAAVSTGTAFLAFLTAFTASKRKDGEKLVYFLGRLSLALLVFETIYLFADFFQSLYQGTPSNQQSVMAVLAGPYSWSFWGIQVFLGTAIPIILLAYPAFRRQVKLVGIAGLLIIIGFFLARLNLILPGLVVPEMEGLQSAFVDPRLTYSYFPTVLEWGLTIGITGFAVLLFLIGYKWLPLIDAD